MNRHRLIFGTYCGFVMLLWGLMIATPGPGDFDGDAGTRVSASTPHLPTRKQFVPIVIPATRGFSAQDVGGGDDDGGYGTSSDDDSGSSYSSNHYHRGFGFGHHSSGSSYGSYGPSHK